VQGHQVLTTHLLDDNVEASESRLSEREVYERDIEWLDACDVLVADASGSSYGVGFEVGYVLGRSERSHQRVVLLYRTEREPFISRLVPGNSHPRCTTIAYANGAELVATVSNHLKPRA
jgi:2'-deoxynucleoside 5'-phosphate N-hydrolase